LAAGFFNWFAGRFPGFPQALSDPAARSWGGGVSFCMMVRGLTCSRREKLKKYSLCLYYPPGNNNSAGGIIEQQNIYKDI
jgi:hypothetical protein